MTPQETVKFLARVQVGKPEECWPWKAGHTLGYGRFYLHGRNQSATHVALMLEGIPIPNGRLVCHRCDNPACVNPAHLFVGSQSDNLKDCVTKGRHVAPIGAKNGQAKLTARQISEIRMLRAQGVPGREVARRYGISQAAVSLIHRRRRWGGSE